MGELKYGEKEIKEAKLERWPNPTPERKYTVDITFPEFTCLCPRSGYPDFATIKIKYIPKDYIVELKSLKLYLNQYRNRYISHEEATNKIFSDLYDLLQPHFLEVIGDWNPRGNVKTIITVSSEDTGKD
ncbi:MAG: NADPH-dependent 7-cyano-7-deazaguanine reductase QueF [Aquificae bacterium]|nr:NADPH-dependent 7-cyano-7-deazaguanine reductase QueF [Aquificota bacterium]